MSGGGEQRRRTITVNGASRVVAADDLGRLLEQLGVGGRSGVAVALNGRVVPRGRWDGQPVADGDEVEIVGAVQGG